MSEPTGSTNSPTDSTHGLSDHGLSELIQSRSVIVCLGPGGVGKTTTAAAIAIAGAKLGLRVAVLTVDPARRLAEAMGLTHAPSSSDEEMDDGESSRGLGKASGLDNEPRLIAGPWDGELWGVMLDVRATFDGLISEYAESDKQRDAILGNRLYQNLTTTLTGTNEYMAAERLRALHADDRFDMVVLDTPPAHHAIDLLDSPGRLSRFVDHRVYRTVLSPKPGVFRAATSAANLVVRAIGQVVGNTLLADAIAFFNDFQGMDQGFRDRAAEIDGILHSDETAYVLISSPRYQPLQASRWIVGQLADRDRSIEAVVFNRMTPVFWPVDDGSRWEGSADPLEQNMAELIRLRSAEEALAEAALPDLFPDTGAGQDAVSVRDVGFVQILMDEQSRPVNDLGALAGLSKSFL